MLPPRSTAAWSKARSAWTTARPPGCNRGLRLGAVSNLFDRGAARAEDAQGTLTQSHISPSILVYEESIHDDDFFGELQVFEECFRPSLVHSSIGLNHRTSSGLQQEGIRKNVQRRFTLEPRPESGLHCLMCAEFARQWTKTNRPAPPHVVRAANENAEC